MDEQCLDTGLSVNQFLANQAFANAVTRGNIANFSLAPVNHEITNNTGDKLCNCYQSFVRKEAIKPIKTRSPKGFAPSSDLKNLPDDRNYAGCATNRIGPAIKRPT